MEDAPWARIEEIEGDEVYLVEEHTIKRRNKTNVIPYVPSPPRPSLVCICGVFRVRSILGVILP